MKRLITGLVMMPLFFWIVAFAPDWVFVGALAAVGCFCLYEFFGILAARFPEYENVQRNPAGDRKSVVDGKMLNIGCTR